MLMKIQVLKMTYFASLITNIPKNFIEISYINITIY